MDFVSHVTVLAGLAVMVVQQALKLNWVDWTFPNRHPVPTLILLSILASVLTVWHNAAHPQAWTDWVQLVTTIGVVAAFVYNMTLKQWTALRAMEGPGAPSA